MVSKFLKLGVSTWLTVALSGCLLANVGCSMILTGAGEMSIGMRNDNFLVLKHSTDGDKEGVKSKSEFEADDILSVLVGDGDEASEAESTDPVSD